MRVCASTRVPRLTVFGTQVQVSCLVFCFSHPSTLTPTSLSSDFIFQNRNWDSPLSEEEHCSTQSWSLGPSAWTTCSGTFFIPMTEPTGIKGEVSQPNDETSSVLSPRAPVASRPQPYHLASGPGPKLPLCARHPTHQASLQAANSFLRGPTFVVYLTLKTSRWDPNAQAG